MRSELTNGGAFCRTAHGIDNTTGTAAGSGDATQVNTDWIDRRGATGVANSAKLIINYTTTLTATKTLTFAVALQDATDGAGTGAATITAGLAATQAAISAGGGTVKGSFEVDVDLGSAREFFRAQITPDLNATGTDTFAFSAVWALFGDHHQPSTLAAASLVA